MGRQDTESADVAEADAGTKVLDVGTILVTRDGITITSISTGVVLSVHRIEDNGNTEITMELDLSRWRQIPAGSDEECTMADDSLIYDCASCGRPTGGPGNELCLCESCRITVGG